jgi:adenine-specific DNA-methyltransferase
MIAPDCKHNALPENANSGNIFITGDNIDALRHLVNAYENQIKLIYIDPPYNTGKEFVYSDKFEFSDEKLKSILGYTDEEIARLKSIQGKSSHSAWLTFMYPRLKIAQKLLKDDGVIFVSIDDNEQANLKLLMDDVFGEGNFITAFIVIRSEGGGLAKQAVIGHDYLLAFAKNVFYFDPLGRRKDIRGKIVIKDGNEYWIETDWLRKEFGKYGTCLYEEIVKYHGNKKKTEVDEGIKNGLYILIKKEQGHIVGRLRKINDDTSKFYTILKHLNKDGNTDLKSLKLENIFDYPKPVSLCKEIVLASTIKTSQKDSIVLDFFAGSATTAHAVMQLNAEDGGNRKFIMVQLDEQTNHDSEVQKKYNTIDEIARERIKNAGEKILCDYREDLAKRTNGWDKDIGFKHYRLITPDVKTLEKIVEFKPEETNLIADDMVKPFEYKETNTSGLDTILSTWLIGDGYRFDTPIEEIIFGNYKAHYVLEAAMLYLINHDWDTAALKDLLNQIGTNKLLVKTIVVYPYSFAFEAMRELKTNIKTNLDVQLNLIERF